MDWGIVVSGAITGVVGIAGIAGTSWQGRRSREAQSKDLQASIDAAAGNLRLSITAEDDRVAKANKHRVYARFHACCLRTMKAAITHRGAAQPQAPQDGREAACPQLTTGSVVVRHLARSVSYQPGAAVGIRDALWVMLGIAALSAALLLIRPIRTRRDFPARTTASGHGHAQA